MRKIARGDGMAYFWYFLFYSFLGYLLEKLFARATHSPQQVRKCFLLLPLCPVYGLALCALLASGAERIGSLAVLLLCGAAVTTAVEYAVHWGYEKLLGVQFWDYTRAKMNVNGRICLPFSLAWGILSTAAVRFVQPTLREVVAALPDAWAGAALLLLIFDAILTVRVLRTYHDTELLSLRALYRRRRAA